MWCLPPEAPGTISHITGHPDWLVTSTATARASLRVPYGNGVASMPPVLPVPPNSTPLRELAHAVESALTLPNPATTRDEVTYLRITRDRARLVRHAMHTVLNDRDIEQDPRDVMVVVASLREQVAELGDDAYDHAPTSS
jgi:hypothetical protein